MKTSKKINRLIKGIEALKNPIKFGLNKQWNTDIKEAIKRLKSCYYFCIALEQND